MSIKDVTISIPDKKKKVVKAGSKLSQLPRVPKHVRESVSLYIQATLEAKKAKDRADQYGEIVIDTALEIQNEEAFSGDYSKSYLIPGLEVKGEDQAYVQYSRSDKFSSFSDEKVVASLKKTLGAVTFNRLFEKELTLQIAPEVFKSKELVKELATLLQTAFGDRIGTFFVKSESYVAKEGLDTAQFNLGSTPEERKEKYEALQLEIRQNKPALKLT